MKYIKNGLNFAETVFTISQMLFKIGVLESKSLYRSRAKRHFYGTEYDIWADFGLMLGQLAILEKKIGADNEQFLRAVFSCFQGQKLIF